MVSATAATMLTVAFGTACAGGRFWLSAHLGQRWSLAEHDAQAERKASMPAT
jgi:hypothetical protein